MSSGEDLLSTSYHSRWHHGGCRKMMVEEKEIRWQGHMKARFWGRIQACTFITIPSRELTKVLGELHLFLPRVAPHNDLLLSASF
jgi:hypothetical protein